MSKQYFRSMGHSDGARGSIMAHLSTLAPHARNAYLEGLSNGKSQNAPKVFTYKLNRKVDALVSGTRVTRSARIPEGHIGALTVTLADGTMVDLPVSRLTAV